MQNDKSGDNYNRLVSEFQAFSNDDEELGHKAGPGSYMDALIGIDWLLTRPMQEHPSRI